MFEGRKQFLRHATKRSVQFDKQFPLFMVAKREKQQQKSCNIKGNTKTGKTIEIPINYEHNVDNFSGNKRKKTRTKKESFY